MSIHSIKFSLRLPEHLLKKIDEAARANYESRSDYIRESIVLRLNNRRIVDEPTEDPYSWEAFEASRDSRTV